MWPVGLARCREDQVDIVVAVYGLIKSRSTDVIIRQGQLVFATELRDEVELQLAERGPLESIKERKTTIVSISP